MSYENLFTKDYSPETKAAIIAIIERHQKIARELMAHSKSELNAFIVANEKLLKGKLSRMERSGIEDYIRLLEKVLDEKECMEITCSSR